ncbi:hypothetical protein VM1G_06833 [Cytospora mali]|uniref:Rhodopsin domain-containing protein n=1 Tax=Cytospora mali TaxID=578113 RepID=A0A194W3S3_CYTMA|nr:hypothetical protein VM1G_06833 [Valsa mali]
MANTIPTTYSLGPNSYLYTEPPGVLRAQVNGVYALSVIFLFLSTVTVALRSYVRTILLKNFGVDDWLLVLTLCIFFAFSILLCVICDSLLDNIVEYAAGQVPTTFKVPQMIVAGYCLYSAATITFKLSLGYFFLKMFSHKKGFPALIWASMVLPGLLGILNIAWTAHFPCQLQSVFFAGLPSCPSFKPRTDWAVVAGVWAGVSAITDLMFGVLAFLAVRNLQMARRTKITAAALCSLGCVGGVAACVRLAFLIAVVPGISVLGQALQVSIWSVIEPGLAIMAAAVAALRPLWMKLRDPNWEPPGRPLSSGRSMRRTPEVSSFA